MRKRMQIAFSPDEAVRGAIEQYMERHGIEGPTAAVRAMILETAGLTPMHGALVAHGQRAYMDVKMWTLQEVSTALAKISQEAAKELNVYAAEKALRGND